MTTYLNNTWYAAGFSEEFTLQPLEDLKPVLLATNSASMRARRVLAQLIKAPQGAAETLQQKSGI